MSAGHERLACASTCLVCTPCAAAVAAHSRVARCITPDQLTSFTTLPHTLPCRYKAGEQVFLCYGRHTNLELLKHYGFVLGSNPHDVAALPPRLLPPAVQQQLAGGSIGGGDSAAAAEALLEGSDGAESGALLHANGAPSWELLRALRLGCATPAERKTSAYLALSDQPISIDSERAAFEGLRAACEAALAELPTTIEQDERERQAVAGELQVAAAAAALDSQAAREGQEVASAAAASGQAVAAEQQRQQQRRQQQAALERLQLAIEWRLCHKRILTRCVMLCNAVLTALPPAAQAPAADIGSRIAALRRQPRW